MSGELVLFSAIGFGFAHAFEPDHMAAVSTFVASRPNPKEALSFGLKWAAGHGLSLLILGTTLYVLKSALEASQPKLFSSGILDQIVGVVLILLGINALVRVLSGDSIPLSIKGWKALLSGKRVKYRSLEAQLVEQQATAKRVAETEAEEELPLFGSPNASVTRASIPVVAPDATAEAKARKRSANAILGGSVLMGLLHGAAGTGAFIGQAAVTISHNDYWVAILYTFLFSLGVLVAMGFYSVTLGGFVTLGARKSVNILRGARLTIGALTVAIGFCLMRGIALPGVFDAFTSH